MGAALEDGRIRRAEKATTTNQGIRYLKLTGAPLKEPAEDRLLPFRRCGT